MLRVLVLSAVSIAFLASSRASAQVEAPLADRIPRDALLYVGWAGTETIEQLYAGSHAEALVRESTLNHFIERSLPQLGTALASRHPDSRPVAKFFTDILPLMARHPTAVAFGGVDYTGEQPLPRLLIICNAGNDAAALRVKMGELFNMVQNVGLFTLMDVQNGVLYLNIGWQKLDLAMVQEDPARALSADARFTAAMQGLIEQPSAAFFLDVPGFARFAEEAARHDNGEEAAQNLRKFLEATGLGGLGSVAATSGFADRMHVVSAFVETRAPRTGLLGLLEQEPIDHGLLELVPADAGVVAAGRFDLSRLLEAARNAIVVTQPNTAGDFEQGLKFINMLVGTDLENDLLGSMGKTWAAYTAPATGDTLLGMVAVNRPTQPAKVESALKNLSLSIVSFINQNAQQKGQPFRLASRQVNTRNGTLDYLDLPVVAPAWGMTGGVVTFGLYPQSAASAQLSAPQASFADSDAFAKITAMAGNKPIRSFTYVDLPRYSGRAYTQINAAIQLGSGLLAGFGETSNITARFPPMVLPPYAIVREHVTPAMSVTYVDERGLHLRASEPFPGSGLLGIGLQ